MCFWMCFSVDLLTHIEAHVKYIRTYGNTFIYISKAKYGCNKISKYFHVHKAENIER